MGQSKPRSALETVTSTAIGYLVAVGSQVIIFPFFNVNLPLGQNMVIALWFTVISLIRGYWVRRLFNLLEL
jgi:hypothetical protein